MTRSHFGMHVTGRIDSISEVQHKEGTTQKGGKYSFYQQTASVTMGGSIVEVCTTSDQDPKSPLINHQLDEIVRFKVQNPRIFNGKVSFDISK